VLFDEASGANFSHFYDPDILARLHEAATLTGEARTATYAQLNLDIMALSPLAVLLNAARVWKWTRRRCARSSPRRRTR